MLFLDIEVTNHNRNTYLYSSYIFKCYIIEIVYQLQKYLYFMEYRTSPIVTPLVIDQIRCGLYEPTSAKNLTSVCANGRCGQLFLFVNTELRRLLAEDFVKRVSELGDVVE